MLALGLVLAGGVLRFHQAWAHRGVHLPVTVQEEGYYEAAIGLLSYQTFSIGVPNDTPRSWRGPLFPVFIAVIEAFSPEPDPGRIRLVQAALATFSILLVFVLGWIVYSPAAGLLGAALLAFNAEHAAAVASLNIHGFYSFLILAACAALVLWSERPTAKSTVLAGVFLGLTLLCRSSHFLLVPFMAAAAWIWRPLAGPRWRAPALLILGASMALAPMTARNRVVTGRWLVFPDAFAGAVALFGATTGHQGLNSYSVEHAVELAEAAAPGFKSSALAAGDLHAAILDLATRRIAADPLRFAGLCLRRLELLARALWLPFVLGLAGLALQRRSRRLQITMITALSFSGYCVAGGAPEHQAATLPLLYLLSGCGGAILLGRLAGAPPPEFAAARGWRRIVLAAGPLMGLALYAACLLALAVEAKQRLWRGDPPSFQREDRALALLRRQAEQGYSPARRSYGEHLSKNGLRWAAAGDCAKAAPRLRRSLLIEPRPEAAGTLAACLAAEAVVAEARALAARYRSRPLTERTDFWKACIGQAELLGGKAPLELLSMNPGRDEDARRRVTGLWLKRAAAAALNGDRSAALESLAQAVKLGPDDAERQMVIDRYQELKEYRLAAVQFDALHKRRAQDPVFWIVRAESSARTNRRAEALEALARAEGIASLSPDERGRVVGLYRELKEERRAVSALEPLLASNPRNAALRLDHAELEARIGRTEKALISLDEAAALPALTPEQSRRAVGLYRHLREPRRGDAALEPLLRRAPKDAGLWIARAEFKSQAGDRAAALAALARAEALGALTRQERRLAVGLYRELKEPRRGASALGPLLEKEPSDPDLWLDSAEFSSQAGDRREALAALARAETLSSDGESRRRLAHSYQSLGEHGRALAIFGELVRRFPADGSIHADKGLCEYLSGDAPTAVATLEQAIKLKPTFIPAYLSLGAVHAAKGRRDEALRVYREGLSRNPESGDDPLRAVLLREYTAAQAQ
jgi:tetratricopeptide (TPR) repeat protein